MNTFRENPEVRVFGQELDDYLKTLTSFVAGNELPGEWFMSPDHVAVKCQDGDEFEWAIENTWRGVSSRISCIKMHERRLATAELTGPLSVGAFGSVVLVEIMEPRPEKVGKDLAGFEHMEFFYPHFERVKKVLNNRRLEFTEQGNPSHNWINIVLNGEGQELKLNDNPLWNIVRTQLESGEAFIL